MSFDKKTPYYLINVQKAIENYLLFNKAIKKYGRSDFISYSIKANYDYVIIKKLIENGAMIEVCSEYEYKFAKKLAIPPNRVIFNGFKNNKKLLYKLLYEGVVVMINSISELSLLQYVNRPIEIGIRVNLDHIKNNDMYISKKSRFGLNIRDTKVFEYINNNFNIHVKYLHCHLLIANSFY